MLKGTLTIGFKTTEKVYGIVCPEVQRDRARGRSLSKASSLEGETQKSR